MIFQKAKQLKDAGFPQEPTIDISGLDGRFFGGFYYRVSSVHNETAPIFLNEREIEECKARDSTKELVKIPQLDDLIEECGDKFGSLDRDDNDGVEWSAFGVDGEWREDLKD